MFGLVPKMSVSRRLRAAIRARRRGGRHVRHGPRDWHPLILAKVDYVRNPYNAYIVAISAALSMIPVVSDRFFSKLPAAARPPLCTAASCWRRSSAVLLNAVFQRETPRDATAGAPVHWKAGAPVPALTAAALSALPREAFVAGLEGIYEHSPWVAAAGVGSGVHSPDAEAVASKRCARAVREAAPDAQLALIRAHPELAGRAAVQGELTPDSTREQSGAGLDQCSPGEFAAPHGAEPRLWREVWIPVHCRRARPYAGEHHSGDGAAPSPHAGGGAGGGAAPDRSHRRAAPTRTAGVITEVGFGELVAFVERPGFASPAHA